MQAMSKIVSIRDILGDTPVVQGARVPVANILAAVEVGERKLDIFWHYPSLPLDGVEVCVEWERQRAQRLHVARERCSPKVNAQASRNISFAIGHSRRSIQT